MADHVRLFLTQNDLGVYADRFIDEGFDNMTSLLDITESDLAELNVKLGHRRKLQRLIAYQKALSYFDPIPINNTPLTPPPSHVQNTHLSSSNILPVTSSNNFNINNNNITSSNINPYTPSAINTINASLNSPKKKIGRIKQVDINSNSSSTNLLLFHQNQIPNQRLLQHQNTIQYPHPFIHHSVPTPSSSTNSSTMTNSSVPQSGSFNHHPLFIFTDLMDNSSKRKYKRHPKPDAMAPVKPLSAYVQFCQDVREELKIEYGKEKFELMSFNEISQEVGQRWRNLDPVKKAELEKIAEQKKKEYDEALKAYEQSENFKKYQLYLIAWHAQQRSQGKKTALDEKFDKKRKRNVEKSQEKSNSSTSQVTYNTQIPHMSYIPTPALSLPINNALIQNNLIQSSGLNQINSSPSFYQNLMMYSQDDLQPNNSLLWNTSNSNNNKITGINNFHVNGNYINFNNNGEDNHSDNNHNNNKFNSNNNRNSHLHVHSNSISKTSSNSTVTNSNDNISSKNSNNNDLNKDNNVVTATKNNNSTNNISNNESNSSISNDSSNKQSHISSSGNNNNDIVNEKNKNNDADNHNIMSKNKTSSNSINKYNNNSSDKYNLNNKNKNNSSNGLVNNNNGGNKSNSEINSHLNNHDDNHCQINNSISNNNNNNNYNNSNNKNNNHNNSNHNSNSNSNNDKNNNSNNSNSNSKSNNNNNNSETNNNNSNLSNNNQLGLLGHYNASSPLKDNKYIVSMLAKHPLLNVSNQMSSLLQSNSQNTNLAYQQNPQQSLLKPTITHYDGQVAVRPPSTPIQNSINTTTTTAPSFPMIIDQNPADLVQTLFQPIVQLPNSVNIPSNYSDSTNTIINSHPAFTSYSNPNPLSLTPHLFTNSQLISPTSVRNLSINRTRPNTVNYINNRNRKKLKR